MSIKLLSEINPPGFSCTIRVRVARMWDFYGSKDDEVLKHLDLVVVDEKGNSMYVEIPAEAAPVLKNKLEEGKVVIIKKFVVEKARDLFKVIPGAYMIKLNKRTEIIPVEPEPPLFPRYVFALTPFDELEEHKNKKTKFIDVIGQIVSVSNAVKVHATAGKIQTKRILKLKNLSGQVVELSLWGKRAIEFNGESVHKIGQTETIIAIFVGTLYKGYRGMEPFLSGTTACRWYINNGDIPEIQIFYNSLPEEQIQPVQKIELRDEEDTYQTVQKSLAELKDLDPFENLGRTFECTVTVAKLCEGQTWYYPACRSCLSRFLTSKSSFKCTKDNCKSTLFDNIYKLCLMGTDGTSELEFVIFDQKAQMLIGKPLHVLEKKYDRFEIPPEVENLVGQKFTFIVRFSTKRSIENPLPSFEVIRIKEQHGRQFYAPTSHTTHENQVFMSGSSIKTNRKPLIPIKCNEISSEDTPRSFIQDDTEFEPMDVEKSDDDTKEKYSGAKRSFVDDQDLTLPKKRKH